MQLTSTEARRKASRRMQTTPRPRSGSENSTVCLVIKAGVSPELVQPMWPLRPFGRLGYRVMWDCRAKATGPEDVNQQDAHYPKRNDWEILIVTL